MDFSSLPLETKARVAECETPEQMLELAKAEGYELNDEELASISGGAPQWLQNCPDDHHNGPLVFQEYANGWNHYICEYCGTNIYVGGAPMG